MTQQALETFACHCAYNLMGMAHIDRAVQVIANIYGAESLSRLLVEALMSTLDASVQTALLEYLRKHQMIDDETEAVLGRLSRKAFRVSLQTVIALSETAEDISS